MSASPLLLNRLLTRLPEQDRQTILADCELIELHPAEVISEPGDRIRHVYFPRDSFVSLMTPPDDHAGLEVRLVGYEGMIGTPLILGVEVTLLRTLVQGAGSAWRLSAGRFQTILSASPALHMTLNRYLFVLTNQVEHMVACTRFHLLEARLARWLLMTRDRARADHFYVTQEFLALMLGVRRVGVTKAASALQARGLIRYRRGDIRILDQAGLQAAACGCYGMAEELYERIMGENVI